MDNTVKIMLRRKYFILESLLLENGKVPNWEPRKRTKLTQSKKKGTNKGKNRSYETENRKSKKEKAGILKVSIKWADL